MSAYDKGHEDGKVFASSTSWVFVLIDQEREISEKGDGSEEYRDGFLAGVSEVLGQVK